MNNANTKEQKNNFYRFSHASQCFYKAQSALANLSKNYNDEDLVQLFTCAFVIYYAKPFRESERNENLKINRKKLPEDILFKESNDFAKILHDKIMLLRDKFYAHTDLDIKNGAKNTCLVESSGCDVKGNFCTNTIFETSGISSHEIPLYQNLLDQLIKSFEVKAHNALEPSLSELTQKGIYELKLGEEPKWFERRDDLCE